MIASVNLNPTCLPIPSLHDAAPGAPGLSGELPTGKDSFSAAFTQAIDRVDGYQQGGDDALRALASGGDVDLHGAMIALEQAEITLHAMVAVRDKVMGAYDQIMNLAI